jgi:ribosomal protein S18 acetylase RimI-like enzyme
VIRLEPMDEADFQAFVERSIPRRAAKWIERGIWTEAQALATSRSNYLQRLPKGRDTPGNHFLKVVEPASGSAVGEVWYRAEEQGGKLQFWVEWIQIEPDHRRKGYATDVLRILEETAKERGADRVGLTVWVDNPGALRLYSKLGYSSANVNMTKRLVSGPPEER